VAAVRARTAAAVALAAIAVAGPGARAARDDDEPLDVPELVVVPGESGAHGRGTPWRFEVEVQHGLHTSRGGFARAVERILFDRRSWTGSGSSSIALERVDTEPADFRVTLASPRMTDRLCRPLHTNGRVSCENRGRAVINYARWRKGTRAWGDNLRGYRQYLINHEVGHSLRHKHRHCPGRRRRAPVMQQQTGGAGACRLGSWPLRRERAITRPPSRSKSG
jgi:uncharacterized protein DUF3152